MNQPDSPGADTFTLLEGVETFREQALAAIKQGQRKVCILSETLDADVYDNDAFHDALRELVIRDRYCKAQILVKDVQPLIERGHRLLELSRRLSSKVAIRKLTVLPHNKDEAYMVVGKAALLYKHDDQVYKGFLDLDAAPRCRSLLDEFTRHWELYGEPDPNLRQQLV